MILSLVISVVVAVIVGHIFYRQARDDAESEDRRLYDFEIGALLMLYIIIFGISFAVSHFLVTPAIGYFLPTVETIERHRIVPIIEDQNMVIFVAKIPDPYQKDPEKKVTNAIRCIIGGEEEDRSIPASTTNIRFDDKSPIRMLKECEVRFAKKWYGWIARSSRVKKWNEIVLCSKSDIVYPMK
ncbi:hypothetical protein D4R87_02775 [bacterium]|nr:MAG: hypothetical protein D4R87_02775 [bacterium]